MTLQRLIGGSAIIVVAACATGKPTSETGTSAIADSAAILRDVAYLASDRLEGRLTGTSGNDSAAAYIARRFASLKLHAPYPGYFQKFEARSAADAHAGVTGPRATQNVVGILRGSDLALRDQYIVIGGHHDHLGRSTTSALDPDARDAIRNGADDNASGTSAVLELARMFSVSRPRRSVVFVTFSGEEQGLLGSQFFVENSPVPLGRIVAMLNFDMVGRMKNSELMVYGTATASELSAMIDSANVAVASPLKVSGSGDGFGSSDHSSFYGKGIPVLHFFTDLHSDYHRASDDTEKINSGGAARVADLAFRITRRIDDRPGNLTFVRSAAPSRSRPGSQGSPTYLGSIPDMAAGTVPGLRLTGVRPGSPADSGGLKGGDIIVEFGGREVKDLYGYTEALYAHKPGDTVNVVFLREGKRTETTVTLGSRGG